MMHITEEDVQLVIFLLLTTLWVISAVMSLVVYQEIVALRKRLDEKEKQEVVVRYDRKGPEGKEVRVSRAETSV